VARKLREDLSMLIEQRYKDVVEIVNEFRLLVQAKILSEEDFPRRAKLINWFTKRTFKNLRNARIKASLERKKEKNI
jgi:hypothetical protein